jgi:hypothetical protein
MVATVVRLDGYFVRVLAHREQQHYPPRATKCDATTRLTSTETRWQRVSWLAGVGPVAWRQWMGANQHLSQLAVAMALPGCLALMPVMICRNGRQALLHVAAAVTFYSFLLLPTALKFDFRRDIMRMAVLKTLPIPPLSLVLGQIATPTLLAFLFQASVLAIALLIRPFPIWMLLAVLLLLGPLNALIFAIDNLVYLLYPYRLNQEGIEIFLRTTLTFTAKGLIFTAGLVATFFWSFAARQIAIQLPGRWADPALIFVLGCGIMLSLGVVLAVLLLAKAYQRFDPSQDVPA